MTWCITRQATREDYEILNKRAMAFIERHELDITDMGCDCPAFDLDVELNFLAEEESNGCPECEGKYLRMLWKRICNRAIGDDGIAYGHVGHNVEE